MMNEKSKSFVLQVVFQQRADGVHLTAIEAEHQATSGAVKVLGEGHLSVNGHLHQGGRVAESAQRALEVYLKGGIDALCDAISGEFVLLVLERNHVYLIADPCGRVPLYWSIAVSLDGKTHLVVGTSLSEVAKTVESIGRKRLQPDATFLRAFIADVYHLFDVNHQTLSPIEGIQRVPGSYRVELCLSPVKKRLHPYLDVNEIQSEKMDLSTAIIRLSEAIESSVHECFSHGRVAVSLSGGIDSGSLAYFGSEFRKSDCVCLTAGLEKWPEIDETALSARTAKHLGLEFHVVDCSEAFSLCHVEPESVYKYGLPVDMLHENEICMADAASQLGAKVMVFGIGGDEMLGVGHTPGYIWDLIRHGKLGDAFRHVMGWTRRMGVSPIGVLSAARKVVHWSPPAFPPFLAGTQQLLEQLADPAAHSANIIKERVRVWNFDLSRGELWWTRSAIYAPRNVRMLHPLFSREVLEASFAIPQWFIQHPDDYKWIFRELMSAKAPSMQFDPFGGVYDSLIHQGALLDKDRILGYFGEECRLVAYGIVSPDIKDCFETYWRDFTVLQWAPSGSGYWWWNAISTEMWLRGFEEVHSN